jgi:signal transduction histidine kinase
MRPRRVWAAYAACLAIATAGLAALTHRALEADRAQAAARQEAAVEENVRLALWRIDSALAALVARETANVRATRLVPPVVETFVIDAAGRRRTLAAATDARDAVRVDAADVLARLPGPAAEDHAVDEPDPSQLADLPVQQAKNVFERRARSQAFQQNVAQQVAEPPGPAARPLAALSAVWAGDSLLLARRVPPGADGDSIEGCMVDWPRLRSELLATIADLLPQATIEPVEEPTPTTDQRLLAAIPARLVPGDVPPLVAASSSPMLGTLATAWAAMAVAAAAVAGLLASVLALSERRAAFVSSVTHELRTPLTTFRLYSGLLEEGMVQPAEVPAYHATLRREADRLTHLVENVLAYARLERGRHAGRLVPLSVQELLDTVTPRPAERARQAGFEWLLEADQATRRLSVTTDPAAVEQVLFNLVDNACKYARGGEPAVIEVTATPRGRSLAIVVRDHGPGVAAHEAARLFEPFRKSARDAAEGAAGVGLGLALSRRLARQMGGDLFYDPPAEGGSRFVLKLPPAATADVARP